MNTELGRLVARGVINRYAPAGLYAKPNHQVIAPGEQALCDFLWLNLREGLDPQSLVTFQNLESLSLRRLNKTLQRYPETVGNIVVSIRGAL